MIIRTCAVLLICLAASCASEQTPSAPEESAQPEYRAALAEEIEAKLTLPDPRFKVADYSRYYRMEGGKVLGLYVAQGKDEAVWVENDDQIPMVMDGGCSVFSFNYDPEEDEFGFISCNGVA